MTIDGHLTCDVGRLDDVIHLKWKWGGVFVNPKMRLRISGYFPFFLFRWLGYEETKVLMNGKWGTNQRNKDSSVPWRMKKLTLHFVSVIHFFLLSRRPVAWDWRIRRRHLFAGISPLATRVLDMIINHLMLRL